MAFPGNAVENPLIDKLRRYTDPNSSGTKSNDPGNPGVEGHLHFPRRLNVPYNKLFYGTKGQVKPEGKTSVPSDVLSSAGDTQRTSSFCPDEAVPLWFVNSKAGIGFPALTAFREMQQAERYPTPQTSPMRVSSSMHFSSY